MSEYVIGFDVGGARIKFGAVMRDGAIVVKGPITNVVSTWVTPGRGAPNTEAW